MVVKKRRSVLFSRAEAELLRSLEQRWTPRFKVYPNLPLSAVVDIDKSELDKREAAFFYKANVDYTICRATNEPLLCIEFDGIGAGREIRGAYRASPDASLPEEKRRRREWALNFKLGIFAEAAMPLIIVGYDDCKNLYDEELSLLDLFISDILIEQRSDELLAEGIEEHERTHDEMTEEEFIDIDAAAGIFAERDYDLALHRIEEIIEELDRCGLEVPYPSILRGHSISDKCTTGRLSLRMLYDPPLPTLKPTAG
jgi:hypothetical protein